MDALPRDFGAVPKFATRLNESKVVLSKEFKSFIKTVGGNEGSKCKYSTRLDTYGCRV